MEYWLAPIILISLLIISGCESYNGVRGADIKQECPLHCVKNIDSEECTLDIGYYGSKYLSAKTPYEKEFLKQEIRSKNCVK